MTVPMPSPRGTNFARAFLPEGSRAAVAYDAAPGPEATPAERMDELLEFLSGKLSDEDLAKVKSMLGMEADRVPAGAADARPIRYESERFPYRDRLK